ncbi:MAG TPA: helix-turn-helix domain-containing protein [Thermoanaerobaculia bacterium]|nr:helix-turn-helix domain-containing protein [Thermoanaerobaculia bacterium]
MKKEAPALPDDLGHLLTVLRTALGFNQQELGEAADVHTSSLSSYEGGITMPQVPTLCRLLEALGVTFAALDLTRSYLADLKAMVRATAAAQEPPGCDAGPAGVDALMDELRNDAQRLLAAFSAKLTQVLGRRGEPAEPAPPVASPGANEDQAEEQWALLKRESASGQRKLLLDDSRFWNRALCERLCRESSKQAARHPNRAFHLADLAVLLAETVASQEGCGKDLRAYATAYQANAMRAQGTLPAADDVFEEASRLWSEAVQEGDVPAGYEARILDLKSSLRRDQRQLAEASALIDQALALEPAVAERGRLLIKKAKIVEESGDFATAIGLLQAAEPFVDAKADPRQVLCLRHNLADYLSKLGRFEEAEALLPSVRTLSRKLNNGLDLVRLRWVEGRVEAGLGRTAKGIELLMQVRGEFATREIAYDTALVTLELAALLAGEGRTADVKALARHLVPIFKSQEVHREALAALALFRQAAERERVTVELARNMLDYLNRARNDPGLRFEAAL